jgi:nucleoside-diphosphate-sugar epimerase
METASQQTVLVVGGTGRTGRRVVEQLLDRGVAVRAIVRTPARLPGSVAGRPGLSVIEASLSSIGDSDLVRYVSGCDAVVSCLGHTISLRGVFGPPHDLVTRAVVRLCRAIETARPEKPVRFVLMSSVSVNQPEGLDTRRGAPEKALLCVLRALVPPARDNQRAADVLHDRIGTGNPCVRWVVVRPDTLVEGDVSEYSVHGALVSSLFRPDHTRMANVAHFLCELATDPAAFDAWRGRLPVIIDAPAPAPREPKV